MFERTSDDEDLAHVLESLSSEPCEITDRNPLALRLELADGWSGVLRRFPETRAFALLIGRGNAINDTGGLLMRATPRVGMPPEKWRNLDAPKLVRAR